MTHPLDTPVWTALATRQALFALGGARAKRFAPDVSPFVATQDDSAAAAADAAALIADGEEGSFLEVAPPAPPVGIAETRMACLQMVWEEFAADGFTPFDIRPLDEADAPEMLALATLTRPGPFRSRTHTMGRFLGVREGGRLIAMAGERLHMPGFHEISAVCTHPDFRGRGLGATLMRAVGARMMAEGDRPFLHSYASNTAAIALYRKLGFRVRAEAIHAVWRRA